MDLLVAVGAEARAKLAGELDPDRLHEIGDAAKAAYAAEHERQHDENGRPRGDHPASLSKAQEADLVAAIEATERELAAARERDREAREAALSPKVEEVDQDGLAHADRDRPDVPAIVPELDRDLAPVEAEPTFEPSFAVRPRTRPRPNPNQPRTIWTQIGYDDD
jgi:hypothetical protein